MKPRTLEDFTGEWRPSGAQLNYQNCPECASQNYKVYLNPENGLWKCFRCDTGGRVEVPRDITAMRRRLMMRYGTKQESWVLAALPSPLRLSDDAMDCIEDRYGLRRDQAERYGLYQGAGDRRGRIVIPYYDRAGDAIYYTCRSFIGEEPKYVNMPGKHPLYVPRFAANHAHDPDGTVVLVEGPFDAIKVHCVTGLDAVAIGGKDLPRYLLHDLLAMQPTRVRVMLDSDAMGAAIKLSNKLAPFVDKVERVSVPAGKDPGSMTAGEILEALA